MGKQSKDAARRKKLAERERRQAAFRERSAYPEFRLAADDAPAEFVEAVKAALAQIDFRDRGQFPAWEAELYKMVRAGRGLPRFDSAHVQTHFLTNLGEQVFSRIPGDALARHIPFSDVLFLPSNGAVHVVFRSLRRARGAGGTTYYSRHRPTVEVGGRKLVVGFSRHAVEQACGRVLARPLCYTNLGDVFAIFDQCLEFEVVRLPGGQLGFTFWEFCPPGFWMRGTARHVLGDSYDPAAAYSYRVGYCPAVVEGDFLKAKTLLYPGWRGTPEHALLRAARLPAEQEGEWLGLLDSMDGMRFRFEARPLLKWFHERGAAQVRQGEPAYAGIVRPEELAAAARLR